jgi:dTDP-4-amino-4,6-dideoxygalactose transaminase
MRRMIPVNSLKEQYESIRAEVDGAIRAVFDRGWFILGPKLTAFEEEFAAYCGVEHGVGMASGTEALQLAIQAAGAQPGDEVITVANTAVPTVAAIRAAGCRPVLVDIDAASYTMDPQRIEAAITPRSRVVLPVHLYGQCADMEPILQLAGARGLIVIEDACQAHGALYRGRRAGSLGDYGCFSYYPTKNLGAYGDAGMVVTRDAGAAERLRLLRNYGQAQRYTHLLEGINSRLDEIQAAVLSVKLRHLDRWNARRRQLAALYGEALADTPLRLPAEAAWGEHVYHLYVVRAPHRSRFQEYLQAHGVGTLIHYPVPIHRQPAYAGLGGAQPLEVTEAVAEEIVTLPLFPELAEAQVREVARVIRQGFAEGVY